MSKAKKQLKVTIYLQDGDLRCKAEVAILSEPKDQKRDVLRRLLVALCDTCDMVGVSFPLLFEEQERAHVAQAIAKGLPLTASRSEEA